MVIGAGVAGLAAVTQLVAAQVPVTLVTAGTFGSDPVAAGNTALAQGGIAAALALTDSPSQHTNDTVAAGAGLVDPQASRVLTHDGVQRVRQLLDAGFPADRTPDGELKFGLEAAHTHPRIIHAGEDSSGAALSTFFTDQVRRHIATGAVRLIDQAQLTGLNTTHGRVEGIRVQTATGTQHYRADAVILATGGFSGLFPTTSSSPAITGSGLLAAAEAGAVVADLEFIQFHPTVLAGTGQLISEAVRGAGAVLRDPSGHRFMVDAHPAAELAPRDVVSRTSAQVMQKFGVDSVWLDATVLEQRDGSGTLARRFPVLTQALATHGIDWRTQYVPVAPAAHYCMGGLLTDSCGRTSVAGLFAAGEVAATGVHGANRLASNSLLEGLVFGARAANAATAFTTHQRWDLEGPIQRLIGQATVLPAHQNPQTTDDAGQHFAQLQQLVGRYLGISRDHAGLTKILSELDDLPHPMTNLVRLIATAALARTESRGGHWRSDEPATDPNQATRTTWQLMITPQHPAHHTVVMREQENVTHVDA